MTRRSPRSSNGTGAEAAHSRLLDGDDVPLIYSELVKPIPCELDALLRADTSRWWAQRLGETPTTAGRMAAAKEFTMPSIYGRFPDPRYLLALQHDELAVLFLGYFRSLPWRQREPVARCVARAVDLYPEHELRPALALALLNAWAWLEAEGFLGIKKRAA